MSSSHAVLEGTTDFDEKPLLHQIPRTVANNPLVVNVTELVVEEARFAVIDESYVYETFVEKFNLWDDDLDEKLAKLEVFEKPKKAEIDQKIVNKLGLIVDEKTDSGSNSGGSTTTGGESGASGGSTRETEIISGEVHNNFSSAYSNAYFRTTLSRSKLEWG